MRTHCLWLAAVLALGAAMVRAEDAAPPVKAPPAPVPAAAPCPAPGADACPPARCGWFWQRMNFHVNLDTQRLKDWLCYQPFPADCGCCRPNTACPPSPYVFFLDRCQPLAGDCPDCTGKGCATCPPREPHVPPLNRLAEKRKAAGCADGGCNSCGPLTWLRSQLGR
jgi:hypothetical protein